MEENLNEDVNSLINKLTVRIGNLKNAETVFADNKRYYNALVCEMKVDAYESCLEDLEKLLK